jgi:hypothetical protein
MSNTRNFMHRVRLFFTSIEPDTKGALITIPSIPPTPDVCLAMNHEALGDDCGSLSTELLGV